MRLLYYYLQIFLPIPLFAIFFQLGMNKTCILGIILYFLIYRPFIDGHRLITMGAMRKEDFHKIFIPFYKTRYLYEMYFKR